jgi:hypothetical protein
MLVVITFAIEKRFGLVNLDKKKARGECNSKNEKGMIEHRYRNQQFAIWSIILD